MEDVFFEEKLYLWGVRSIYKYGMNRRILLTGAFLGLTSVILGAFGAHGLKKMISVEAVQTFEVGVRYQMYHALFLLFVGLSQLENAQKRNVFWLILLGTICFSGSIYALSTNELYSFFDFRKIALITPLGGCLLILGWTLTLNYFFRKKNQTK